MFSKEIGILLVLVSFYGCATAPRVDQAKNGNAGYVLGEIPEQSQTEPAKETRRVIAAASQEQGTEESQEKKSLSPLQVIQKADKWIQKNVW